MALGDPYLTVAEFKARTKSVSVSNDDAIGAVLLAASRQVDGWCGRTFNKSDEDEERFYTLPRYGYGTIYDGYGGSVLSTGDIVSVSELATDNGTREYPTVWETDDFDLYPFTPDPGFPYTQIRRSPLGVQIFPVGVRAIRVTGIFGFPEVPAPIKEATFITANRLKSLWDAPFGVSGGGEMGTLQMATSVTPIIAQMLEPYRVRAV
jgi:hypothetical protein